MSRFSPLLICVLAFASTVQAQDTLHVPSEPVDWGDISPEQIRADDYPADSNASAVILSDYGMLDFKPHAGEFELEVHTRIKILGEEGFDYGTVTVPYYAEDRLQDVSGVEGATYTLEDGDVQEHEFDDDNVFEEDIDGEYERIRFTMPNLEPGAVIEYRYELDSESWVHIPSWAFQHGEPTLYSEYRVHVPKVLRYVTLTTGAQNYHTVETERNRTTDYTELQRRWVMTELPALREEPYITTLEDYRSRIRLQLKELRNPTTGVVEERFMSSWPDLAETLLNADYFGDDLGDGGGGMFGGEGAVEKKVGRLTSDSESDATKMHDLYDYVRSTIQWTGETNRVRDQDFDEILETQSGNSAEVNLLLVSMLQNAGLKAHPVLISTRDNGRVYRQYPFVNQFNSVIAAVNLPDRDERVLLDATEPLCPASMLPKRDLNQRGWLVRKKPEWIDIPAPTETHRRIFVKGTLADDGTLSGEVDVQENGFRALNSRQVLQDKSTSDFLRETLFGGPTGLSLSDVSIVNQDSVHRPLKTSATVELSRYAQQAGNMIYVTPRLMPTVTENPLHKKERRFPVDFAYPRKETYILSLQLPDGYTVEDVPTPQRVKLPNGEGQFTRTIRAQGQRLMVRSIMELPKPEVPPRGYNALREFFGRVVAAQSEQVVLEETTAQAASPTTGSDGGR